MVPMPCVSTNSDTPTVIQVVPRRTIEPNGVADYAIELARALRAHNGVKTIFVSGSVSAQAMPTEDEWKTVFGAAGISVACRCDALVVGRPASASCPPPFFRFDEFEIVQGKKCLQDCPQ